MEGEREREGEEGGERGRRRDRARGGERRRGRGRYDLYPISDVDHVTLVQIDATMTSWSTHILTQVNKAVVFKHSHHSKTPRQESNKVLSSPLCSIPTEPCSSQTTAP